MEMTVKRTDFVNALDKISGIVPVKPSITILTGVLIEAKDDGIFLTATDLENTMRTTLKGSVQKKGTVLLPGKKLISLVRQLADDELKLSLRETQVVMKTQNSEYTFYAMNAEEFPKPPKFSGAATMKMAAADLKSSIDRVRFCVYPEEPRPHFRGALFEIKDAALIMVATDTKRLSVIRRTLEGGAVEPVKCLLPHRLLGFLSGILGDGEVEISIGKNQVFIKIGESFLISQLLEGSQNFPDYEKVIPEEARLKVVKLAARTFDAMLKRVSLFTSERYNKVRFSFAKGRLLLTVSSPDVGEAQEKITIDYDGEEQNIAFNPEFISDFVDRAGEETILFGFTNESRPVLLRPEKNTEYQYVAMPLKLE